jgi:hypothetical protein
MKEKKRYNCEHVREVELFAERELSTWGGSEDIFFMCKEIAQQLGKQRLVFISYFEKRVPALLLRIFDIQARKRIKSKLL